MNIQVESDTLIAWRLLYTLTTDLPGDWRVRVGGVIFSVLTLRAATRWISRNPGVLPTTPYKQQIAQFLKDRGTDAVLLGLLDALGEDQDDSWIVF